MRHQTLAVGVLAVLATLAACLLPVPLAAGSLALENAEQLSAPGAASRTVRAAA